MAGVESREQGLVLLGVAIPNLELFISLIGAFCLAALGIAFPALIDQSTFWYQRKGWSFVKMSLQNAALVIFGAVGLVVGTYVAISNINSHFANGSL
ncbi:hypothetical protein RUM43_002624 [Polyplax serrata]|uniref:Amino acid transporter transmembrane domain-containing protein n=1 Tax=Polyplax serrata TaxID=468196 RepID=A0AAN8RW15_POLSC